MVKRKGFYCSYKRTDRGIWRSPKLREKIVEHGQEAGPGRERNRSRTERQREGKRKMGERDVTESKGKRWGTAAIAGP